jgi:hypothetical protein
MIALPLNICTVDYDFVSCLVWKAHW